MPDTLEIASAAYRLSSDGTLADAYSWQADLYQRLSDPASDIGGLLLAPAGAGKLESVVIPALGLRRGGAPRRLFIIGPDGSPLDDYLVRLVPYLRTFVCADETPRTLCLDLYEEEDQGNQCRRFFPDGSEDPHIITNPLEADVDLILTTLSRFQSLFFGSGGIHALPTALIGDNTPLRRDLFFFDEAHLYTGDGFARFHRLTEFLYAEDADVIVASSTLPPAFAEELSFLDLLPAPPISASPRCTFRYKPSADPHRVIETELRRAYDPNARVFAVTETSAEAEALHARLAADFPATLIYHADQPAESRRRIYAQLRELEKAGKGCLLLTTGEALESSDLSAFIVLSTLCPPENLIRRAGRCNRHGTLPQAQIILSGDTFAPTSRTLSAHLTADYLAALRALSALPFDPEFWKAFI